MVVKSARKSTSARDAFKAALKSQKEIDDKPVTKKKGLPKHPDSSAPAPHLMVFARAGTGKTTTMVGGIARLCQDTVKIKTPSDQQLAIWKEMEREIPVKIRVCAFSKAIETELSKRLQYANVETRTCHGFGNSFLRADSRCRFSKMEQYKTSNVLEAVVEMPYHEMRRKGVPTSQIEEVVQLAKMNLVNPADSDVFDQFEEIITKHGIECNGSLPQVLDLSQRVLQRSMEFQKNDKGYWWMPEFDFADMIWLPVVLDLQISQADLVIVDEAQDLNHCQQELVLRMGRRLALVGDPKQAIFAFAGADCQSMSHMAEKLRLSSRGLTELPLNITYRCGKKIVEKAQTMVPDYQAYDANPEGEIREIKDEKLVGELLDGDMVICRTNAPLVSTFFQLLKLRKKARIQGRDIGQGLIKLIDRLKANTIPELEGGLMEWHAKEEAKLRKKKYVSEPAMIALNDKLNCLMEFVENSKTVQEVRDTISAVFSDNNSEGVLLTSAHRAKGLEADRVYIIRPEQMPHPMAKTPEAREQESNLQYVAWTRAINVLTFVKTTEKEKNWSVG